MSEQFDIPEVGQEQDSYEPATKETEEEGERKMCRLVMVASGMQMRQNESDEQICEEKSTS